jgi:hypothetical protein
MGLKILVLSAWVVTGGRDWDLLGSAWMEEVHLGPKRERRTKQDGRGRNEREGWAATESVGQGDRVMNKEALLSVGNQSVTGTTTTAQSGRSSHDDLLGVDVVVSNVTVRVIIVTRWEGQRGGRGGGGENKNGRRWRRRGGMETAVTGGQDGDGDEVRLVVVYV